MVSKLRGSLAELAKTEAKQFRQEIRRRAPISVKLTMGKKEISVNVSRIGILEKHCVVSLSLSFVNEKILRDGIYVVNEINGSKNDTGITVRVQTHRNVGTKKETKRFATVTPPSKALTRAFCKTVLAA